MLNILHTADWHLGAKLYNASREEEHRRFLDWLLRHAEEAAIDLLLVAGDIFHYTQPSADATALYYHFLARAAETSLRQIVIVGGNHDSASRLDAPREVLKVLDVHVVGGLSADRDTWDRCLCPVRGHDGTVEVVVVAIPFVHEFRLGVRTTGMEPGEAGTAIEDAFQALYTELADRAEARWPGVPLIATGHMTCKGAPVAGYNTPIHLSAMIGGLPADRIFDPRYSYIALGHIHALHNCEHSNAWYCGSPLPLNVLEARSPRTVLHVELDPTDPRAAARAIPIAVPLERQLVELRGDAETVVAQIDALTIEGDLEPYIWVDV
ncbi:MAG: exonuclease subunit SbcD, partial [Myxococcota bacterium]